MLMVNSKLSIYSLESNTYCLLKSILVFLIVLYLLIYMAVLLVGKQPFSSINLTPPPSIQGILLYIEGYILMIKISLNSYDLWTAASRMKIPWNFLLLLKAFLDLMSNVFSYMLMIETMGIVVPREILKMNVRYCVRRVVVFRLLLPPLSSGTPCNALASLPSLFPVPQGPAQCLPHPSKVFCFLGRHGTADCISVVSDLHLFHLQVFPICTFVSPSPC